MHDKMLDRGVKEREATVDFVKVQGGPIPPEARGLFFATSFRVLGSSLYSFTKNG